MATDISRRAARRNVAANQKRRRQGEAYRQNQTADGARYGDDPRAQLDPDTVARARPTARRWAANKQLRNTAQRAREMNAAGAASARRELTRRQNRARTVERIARAQKTPMPPRVKALLGTALKKIKKYEKTGFLLPYAVAFGAETFDLVGAIPVFGLAFWIFAALFRLYIKVFIFIKTTKLTRALMAIGVLLLEMIPVINLLPFTVLSLYWLQNHLKEEAREAEKTVARIGRKYQV